MLKPSRALAASVLVAGTGVLATCGGLVDPDLPWDAAAFPPPAVYATWWKMTEACSGTVGSLDAVSWYLTPYSLADPRGGQPISGYWSAASNRIVLAGAASLDGGAVRHEMLHALVRTPGHARNQFLGACAGVVVCQGPCIGDAGLAPQSPPGEIRVPGDAIEVSLEVVPTNPRPSYDGGFFTVIVKARNPAAQPVFVTTTVGAPGQPSGTFFFHVHGPPRGISGREPLVDPSQSTFAAGETKRHVFDFLISTGPGPRTLPPGTYSVEGSYAGHSAEPITVVLAGFGR